MTSAHFATARRGVDFPLAADYLAKGYGVQATAAILGCSRSEIEPISRIILAPTRSLPNTVIAERRERERAWAAIEAVMADAVTPRKAKLAVVAAVAMKHGLTLPEIMGADRRHHVAHARQEAFWVLRDTYPEMSLPAIGRMFGKDHTTVLHGIRQHEKRRAAE